MDLLVDLHRIYYFIFILVFVILFIVLIFSYSRIGLAILRSKANMERHNRPIIEQKTIVKSTTCLNLLCCKHKNKITKTNATDVFILDAPTMSTQASNPTEIDYILPESSISGSDGDEDNHLAKTTTPLPKEKPITVRKVDKNNKAKRSLRTTRLTFLVCLVFLLSWLPPWSWFVASNFVTPFNTNFVTYMTLRLFLPMTFLVNTFTNPLLYIALNESFREKVKTLIICKK